MKKFFETLFNWERWNFFVLYAPISPVWLWYCLRSGSLWYFSSSNPTITFGGFEGEGKKEEEMSDKVESPPVQTGSSEATIPTDTANSKSVDREIELFNIEEMMNCKSLIVFLQAATFVPQIHDILFSSTVDEIYHEIKRQIRENSANLELLESAKQECDLFDEVCLLFRNLWDLVRKDKIVGRPEGLMNCIGYLNSKIQLI